MTNQPLNREAWVRMVKGFWMVSAGIALATLLFGLTGQGPTAAGALALLGLINGCVR